MLVHSKKIEHLKKLGLCKYQRGAIESQETLKQYIDCINDLSQIASRISWFLPTKKTKGPSKKVI